LITIIGGLLSPYVRKVLTVCELKALPYRIDPIVPFFGGARFTAISPLRRIPVLIDDRVTLADSSAICQYLEDRYPSPPVFPEPIVDRAMARWLEEYADTRIGDVFIWKIFNEACIKPGIWKQPRDLGAIQAAVETGLPSVMDYLEQAAPADGFVFGAVSIADLSVGVFFRNLTWSRIEPDRNRWPKTTAWISRIEAIPAVTRLSEAADSVLRVPPTEAGAALAALGFDVVPDTMGETVPRRGPMTVV
jgi:glutathione S-transferase